MLNTHHLTRNVNSIFIQTHVLENNRGRMYCFNTTSMEGNLSDDLKIVINESSILPYKHLFIR